MSAGAATGALAGYQVISGFQQAEMVREGAKLNRELADMNADAALIDAYHAEVDGLTMEARYGQVIEQTLDTQTAIFAHKGVNANFGTAAAIQAESKLNGKLNQMDIRNQAHSKALGYENQASNIRLQARLNSLASNTQAAAIQGAALINGGATALSGYSKFKGPALSEEGGGGSGSGLSGYSVESRMMP